jgi:hypothetical protein
VNVLLESWPTARGLEYRQALLRALSISRHDRAIEFLQHLAAEGRPQDAADARAALAWISHRVCPGSGVRGSARNLQQRRPKNDIHACNVYYAERPADQPKASENVGRMSFVALRQCSVWPAELVKYFN